MLTIFVTIHISVSGLVGVACDNFQLKIVDVETGGVARSFDGPSGRITDIVNISLHVIIPHPLLLLLLLLLLQLITPNSRWLIVSSMDCSITTWDIPSGHKVDVFYTSSPALSITVSSLGHFLASCHVDELGIFLWYVVGVVSGCGLCTSNDVKRGQDMNFLYL